MVPKCPTRSKDWSASKIPMRELLEFIVKKLVDNPDQVEIQEKTENGYTIFTLKVSEADMGKIIGKEGKIIRSLRTILKIPAIKERKKVSLALVDEQY